MRRGVLALAIFASAVLADVEFVSPAAGAHVSAGTISVSWKESGIAPSIEDLTAYTLSLMVGGQKDSNMLQLATFMSQGDFSTGNEANGTIPSGIAGPVNNGFFFKITSSSSTGGIVVNYSDRFTITGLTGTTGATYRHAVEALNGNTNGPGSRGDSSSSTSISVTSSTSITRHSQTSATPTGVTVTKRPSATSSSTASSTPSSQKHGGLAKGALVGIAVAGLVVGLVGLGAAVWTCLRRKRRKEVGLAKLNSNIDLPGQVARKEMTVAPPVELDPWAKVLEADDGARRPEMDGMAVRAELEGDSAPAGIIRMPSMALTSVPATPVTPMTLDSMTIDTLDLMVSPKDNV